MYILLTFYGVLLIALPIIKQYAIAIPKYKALYLEFNAVAIIVYGYALGLYLDILYITYMLYK